MQPSSSNFFDPRHAPLLRLGLLSSLASATLFTISGSLAASISQPTGVFVFLSLALPLCSYHGIRTRSLPALAAFCCCSGFLLVLYLLGAISLLRVEKPVLSCVCDITCSALPTTFGMERGFTNPSQLRNTTLYADLCARAPAVYSTMDAYVALGALGLLAQFLACTSLCHIRNKWSQEASAASPFASPPAEGALASQQQQQQRVLYNPHAAAASATSTLAAEPVEPAAPVSLQVSEPK